MIGLIAAIAVAATASAAPQPANTSTGGFASPPTKADAAGNPSEIICKHIATVGTHIPKSDCRSRQEWNQLAADSRQATHDLVNNQDGYGIGGGAGVVPKFNGK